MWGNWLRQLTAVRSADPEVRRRGATAQVIVLGEIALSLLFIPVTITQPNALQSVLTLLIALAAFVAIFATVRAGRVTLGALLLIAIITLAILPSIYSPVATLTPFFLFLPIAIAGATLRPAQIWWVLAVALALLWAVVLAPPRAFLALPDGLNTAIAATLAHIMLALLVFLGARSTSHALGLAHESEGRATQARDALAHANQQLEQRIDERTSELRAALAAQRAQAEELSAALAAQQQLSQAILELSLPIIPLRDDVLVVPLVGNIDSRRAHQLLDTVLGEIERRRARVLVLDVTGVPLVDTAIAQTLLRVADATRLLGGRTVLVGIRPEVAQALVSLGVDLHTITTAASLQDALRMIGAR